MDSPPHLPDNIESILQQILHSQQICLHTMSVYANTLSTFTASLAPTRFPHINTNNTSPWASYRSVHQRPPIYSSPNLYPHNPYQHYTTPVQPPTIPRPTASVPLFFVPTMMSDVEEHSQELIADGSNFTITDENALSVTVDFFVTNNDERLKELIAEENDQDETPHQDPPSIFLNNASISTPLFFKSTEQDPVVEKQKAILAEVFKESLNLVLDLLDVVFSGSDYQSGAFFAQSPSYSTIKIFGSKLCFALISLAPDPICSSCFAFETFAWATTVPEKTVVNTIFVFDPGGSFTNHYHSSVHHRLHHQKFHKLLSLLAVWFPSSHVSGNTSLPVIRLSPGPASCWPCVPWSFGHKGTLGFAIGTLASCNIRSNPITLTICLGPIPFSFNDEQALTHFSWDAKGLSHGSWEISMEVEVSKRW